MNKLDFQAPYIIAEIGVNHNGNIEIAKKMVKTAKESGAHAVKFQTFKAETLVGRDVPKVKYQEETTDKDESHFEMLKSLEFKYEDHLPVLEYCQSLGIEFISTPYDVESATFLKEIGVKIFKTASADIIDYDLHTFLAKNQLPTIISTGMASLGEVEEVINLHRSFNNESIYLLHCVANYPCSIESLNLNIINTLRNSFHVPTGFSDHSVGPYAAMMSIAMGARIIEKHFTLDKIAKGPDHKASIEPHELKELSTLCQNAFIALGSPVKRCQEEEKQMSQVSRKSVTTAHSIKKGQVIQEKDLVLKRPGTGLHPRYKKNIIKKTATRDLEPNQLLQFGDFE